MITRTFLALACAASGHAIVFSYGGFPLSLVGALAGLAIAVGAIKAEQRIRRMPLRMILGGVTGTIVGLFIAFFLVFGLRMVSDAMERPQALPWIYVLFAGVLGYLGLVLGSQKSEEVRWFRTIPEKDNGTERILDTSVIIDGRIADICATGFLEGRFVVPRFVLDELQHIADSADAMKRSRGRRGLDVLNRMQKSGGIAVEVVDQDFPKIKGVDAKLVALAKKTGGRIVTNDFNLNKVAELQGVRILNVNDLSNALKPVVLPGEQMVVKIIREGKEPGQGIAYLDDGTMIVVDNGQRQIGATVEAVVTSVLQTTAGRMIFSELKEGPNDRRGASVRP